MERSVMFHPIHIAGATPLALLLCICLFVACKSVETVFNIRSHAGEEDYSDLRYRGQTFLCVPGDNCTFNCTGEGIVGTGGVTVRASTTSCTSSKSSLYSFGACECSHITCSDGGYHCHVYCHEANSCFRNTVNCGDDSDECNIHCSKENSCRDATINCGENSKCNLYSHGWYAGSSITFNCGQNSTCNLYCNGESSCRGLTLNCASNSDCYVECNAHGQYNGAGYECYDMAVNANTANSLSIDVYNNLASARFLKVFAPNTKNRSTPTVIKCGIDTFDSSSAQYACDEMNIHAVDGFHDVQVQVSWVAVEDVFTDFTAENQRMYCGMGDEYFCYGWKKNGSLMECHSDIIICNYYDYHALNAP